MQPNWIAAAAAAVALCACQQQDRATTVTEASAPTAPSAPASNTAEAPAANPLPTNGAYELADVLKWAMPDAPTNTSSTPDLQDYNRFKGVVGDIKRSASLQGGYEGRVVLAINSVKAVAENIEDDYAWRVSIEGPNAGAAGIAFASHRAIRPDVESAGPAYLRSKGLDVVALSCFSDGGTSANAEGLYLVRVPRKAPTFLTYSVSTGSAGTFVTYRVHFGAIDWSSVPGTSPDFQGKVQPFGVCPYKDFR